MGHVSIHTVTLDSFIHSLFHQDCHHSVIFASSKLVKYFSGKVILINKTALVVVSFRRFCCRCNSAAKK